MAIATVVTRGFSTASITGSIPLVTTRGYATEAAAAPAGGDGQAGAFWIVFKARKGGG